MSRASDKGTLIEVFDIKGKSIKNGDLIKVQHVNYAGTGKEYVDEEFTARVFYHGFRAAFMYVREGVKPGDEDDSTYHFNHRSSRFEILEEPKSVTSIESARSKTRVLKIKSKNRPPRPKIIK